MTANFQRMIQSEKQMSAASHPLFRFAKHPMKAGTRPSSFVTKNAFVSVCLGGKTGFKNTGHWATDRT
jgi:hypothetical protein